MALADQFATAARPVADRLLAGLRVADADIQALCSALVAYDTSVGNAALDGPTTVDNGGNPVDIANPALYGNA